MFESLPKYLPYVYWPGMVIGLGWVFWRTYIGREVERRVIFLFMGLAVSGSVIIGIRLPVKETNVVRAIFDSVEQLKEGDVLLVSLDYDPSAAPELEPMASAVTRHSFARGVKICFMTLWGTGGAMITSVQQNYIEPEFPDKEYGVDYCNVGYKAGNEAVLRVIASDFKKTFPVDVFGTLVDSLPIMEGINSCPDFDYIIAIGSGRPGIKEWVEYVSEPTGALVGGGASAVSAPQLYPYYPRRLNGIMGGSKGASEYETMLKKAYPRFGDASTIAIDIMGPQTVAHALVIILIIFANVAYFRTRNKVEGGR